MPESDPVTQDPRDDFESVATATAALVADEYELGAPERIPDCPPASPVFRWTNGRGLRLLLCVSRVSGPPTATLMGTRDDLPELVEAFLKNGERPPGPETEDDKFVRRADAQIRRRVRAEGFEEASLEPAEGDRCQYRVHRKSRGRWKYEPCGHPPLVVLDLRGPDHPGGMKVPLCRSCLVAHVRGLLVYLAD